jgi:hypothetical protein
MRGPGRDVTSLRPEWVGLAKPVAVGRPGWGEAGADFAVSTDPLCLTPVLSTTCYPLSHFETAAVHCPHLVDSIGGNTAWTGCELSL